MEARKDWSAPAVLAGKICEMQDEPRPGLDFYVRAIYHMGERDSDVIRRTVQLLVPAATEATSTKPSSCSTTSKCRRARCWAR